MQKKDDKFEEKGLHSSISFYHNEKIDRERWLHDVFPEWGTYLNKQIENTAVAEDSVAIWWTGACGYVIKTPQTTLMIDNYAGTSMYSEYDYCAVCRVAGAPSIDWLRVNPQVLDIFAVKRMDAEFLTHHHNDHCDIYTVNALLANTDSKFYAPRNTVLKLEQLGVPAERKICVKPGDSIKFKDMEVLVLESYDPSAFNSGHTGKEPESMDECAVCYLLKTKAGNILHIGDAHFSDLFKAIGDQHEIDIAFIPFGSNARGVSDKPSVFDAVRIAEDLKAKIAIPMHYDNWANSLGDPQQFARYVKENLKGTKPIILQSGGKFEYPADSGIEFYQYPKVGSEQMGGMDWKKSKKYGEVRNWKL